MKYEKQKYQPISVQWKGGFDFLRSGKIGDSVNYFGIEEEEMIDRMLLKSFPDGVPNWFKELNVL